MTVDEAPVTPRELRDVRQYGQDTFSQPQDLFEHQLEVLAGTVGLA